MLKTLILALTLQLAPLPSIQTVPFVQQETKTHAVPTLTINQLNGIFTATFEAGAVWANISLTSHNQTIVQDGKTIPYVVYYNYEISPKQVTFFDSLEVTCTTEDGKPCPDGDDWDIVLSVGYPQPNAKVPTTTDVIYVDSAPLTLHHS